MLLDSIDSPKDLKSLTLGQLQELAAEIRDVIINTTAQNGGHIGPSLGVVELTLALHYTLDSPKDKIIWDVGHQAYAHKILTGRLESMKDIRKRGGISGFPKRAESPHDIIDTGHASTSCSAGAGIAEAMKLTGRDGTVVAVIGDGALSGGLAYEALNNAGHMKTPLIVILNDNEMSISRNVGAMAGYLSRIRVDPTLAYLKEEFESRIERLPAIGDKLHDFGSAMKGLVKGLILPGRLFEDLGFVYIGPLDGNNIEQVARDLSMAKQLKVPVLMHVLTKKGKGYGPAEEKAEKFHGIEPFEIETGEPLPKESTAPTYTKVFGDAVMELARRDDRIVAITAAMAPGTGLDDFREEFPGRFYDVGIAEEHAVTFAAGLALEGMRPVVAIYSTFLQRSYDQIVHDVCLNGLPVVFAIDRAGLVGEDGPTHHGAFDLSYLRHVPNMVVMSPRNEAELRDMLFTAVQLDRPVAIRYPRGTAMGVPMPPEPRPVKLGSSVTLSEGKDVCLLALGRMVGMAEEAASLLSEEGISAGVIDLRFVKPLDEEAIVRAALAHPVIATVEENALAGGTGSAILELLGDRGLKARVERFGLPDRFIAHGETFGLLDDIGLSPRKIAARVRSALDRRTAGLGT